jgi:hypothetical protein
MSSRRYLPCAGFVCALARSVVGATAVAAVALGLTACSSAAVVFPGSGTSALGRPVSFSASFAIAGDTLTLDLSNTSPTDTTDAADVLSSFYFDIASGTNRPLLTYVSGSGFVYLVTNGSPDMPYVYKPQTYTAGSGTASNLKAVNNGDATWQFRVMDTGSSPNLGFGIGTVGNSALSPNGFTPGVVGPAGTAMINFSIYKGANINPAGLLNYRFLVKDTARFTFSGVTGFTEADIVDKVVFGLGTAPDSTITVSMPEPRLTLAAITLVGVAARTMRRRTARA